MYILCHTFELHLIIAHNLLLTMFNDIQRWFYSHYVAEVARDEKLRDPLKSKGRKVFLYSGNKKESLHQWRWNLSGEFFPYITISAGSGIIGKCPERTLVRLKDNRNATKAMLLVSKVPSLICLKTLGIKFQTESFNQSLIEASHILNSTHFNVQFGKFMHFPQLPYIGLQTIATWMFGSYLNSKLCLLCNNVAFRSENHERKQFGEMMQEETRDKIRTRLGRTLRPLNWKALLDQDSSRDLPTLRSSPNPYKILNSGNSTLYPEFLTVKTLISIFFHDYLIYHRSNRPRIPQIRVSNTRLAQAASGCAPSVDVLPIFDVKQQSVRNPARMGANQPSRFSYNNKRLGIYWHMSSSDNTCHTAMMQEHSNKMGKYCFTPYHTILKQRTLMDHLHQVPSGSETLQKAPLCDAECSELQIANSNDDRLINGKYLAWVTPLVS
ncbi:hypothetical protein WN51_07655 [Melipona quadrifasciata]|uniref:Uncharacterized protein n=1 Tax=Melipona quadrifasciata TaxID=166423 RepID=A0A0N0U2Q7_9HYME|nr:hypothetical protein WN51_07655 [Melipona quadrifasciata]